MKRLFYYLVSTDHLSERLWFRDDEDFKVGMNYVAILAASANVRILAFILMSNHVHFVIEGSEEKANLFFIHFKRLYGAWYEKKYGTRSFLRRNSLDVQEVWIEDESLLRAIAYVIDNPVAANICTHPTQYIWGSGNVLFNMARETGTKLSEFSVRKQRAALHSKAQVNQKWEVGRDGYILPHTFMPTEFIESLFRTPKRLDYFIKTSSKAKARLEKGAAPGFTDQVIIAAIKCLCQTQFRCSSIEELSENNLGVLLLDLRRRFNADAKQLARIIGRSYEETSQLLDRAL